MAETREFGESRVTFDDRFSPILITIWEGRATLEGAVWASEVVSAKTLEAAAAGRQVVTIGDASAAVKPPPEVRRFFAEQANRSLPGQADTLLSSYVVLTSSLMRGVVTAVGWVSQAVRRMQTVPSLEHAIRKALEDLDAEGIPRPEGLEHGYVPLSGTQKEMSR